MPKVIMLVSMAAADWSLVPGDETDVTDEVAKAWDENGIAKLVYDKKNDPTLINSNSELEEGGDINASKDNNTTSKRTNKSSASKKTSKS